MYTHTRYTNLIPWTPLHEHIAYMELCPPLRRSIYMHAKVCNAISTHHLRTIRTSPATLAQAGIAFFKSELLLPLHACGSHLVRDDPSTEDSAAAQQLCIVHTHIGPVSVYCFRGWSEIVWLCKCNFLAAFLEWRCMCKLSWKEWSEAIFSARWE